MMGRILTAADMPWFKTIFKVERDLTGWYASIIAAKKEKKLPISISPSSASFPE